MRILKLGQASYLVILFLVGLLPLPLFAAQDADKPTSLENVLDGSQLVEALRTGGYIIYFRHGITDHSTFDTDHTNLTNCATQRLLSEEGHQQMKNIGELIATLGIKVSTILSSPYCRTIVSAVEAFGKVDIDYDLKHTVTADEAMVKRQAQALRKILSTVPEVPGTNVVLSGHTANLQEVTGIWPKPEGVAVIFKPGSGNGFSYIATVPPQHWQELVKGQ